MLSVQSVNLMSQPSFGKRNKGSADKGMSAEEKVYRNTVNEWENVRDNLEGLEDIVPEQIKKPYKWLKVGSSAVITGLGVVWASKKSGEAAKAALTSDFSKKAVRLVTSTGNKIKKPFVTAYNHVAEFAGKKLSGTKAEKTIDNAKKVILDNKAVTYLSEQADKAKKYAASKLNGIKFEKVNNITAGVLGTGSGLAAGYEVARGDA